MQGGSRGSPARILPIKGTACAKGLRWHGPGQAKVHKRGHVAREIGDRVWQEVCREVAGRGGLLIQRGLGVRGARLLDFRLRDSPVRH